MDDLKAIIRDVPDFPQKGVIFKDITPLLSDKESFRKMTDALKERYAGKGIDMVVGVEARGFVMSSALAYAIGAGCGIIRKPGKLPYKTHSKTYDLEYGTDTVEIHQDAIADGQKILLIDDVLATGGTMAAVIDMVHEHFKAEVVEVAFLIELDFLNGREKLGDVPVHSLLHY